MKELYVKENGTGLRVFINGIPDIAKQPKTMTDTLIVTLEREVSELFDNERRRESFQNT